MNDTPKQQALRLSPRASCRKLPVGKRTEAAYEVTSCKGRVLGRGYSANFAWRVALANLKRRKKGKHA